MFFASGWEGNFSFDREGEFESQVVAFTDSSVRLKVAIEVAIEGEFRPAISVVFHVGSDLGSLKGGSFRGEVDIGDLEIGILVEVENGKHSGLELFELVG